MTAGSLDAGLVAMMNQTVTVYQSVTRDAYGKRTLGAGTTVAAYITEGGGRTYTTPEGDEVPIVAVAYLSEILRVDPASDVVELPTGVRPKVVDSTIYYDEVGNLHHERVRLTSGGRA